ncbi:MAG TPA: Gfo/Idh/MocA family oxidoreductase [Galbitalea sp.]
MPTPDHDAKPATRVLGVAIIGHSFMGRIHAEAWQTAPKFFELGAAVRVVVVSGRDERATTEFADRFGIVDIETDWRAVLERDDVDIVDICVPGRLHADIAIAALAAGKHVLCEKPLANTLAEAEAMAAAAEAAGKRGVLSMVGFSYRRTPALAYAKRLIDDGRLGLIRHIRSQYLQDWIVDPDFPLVWRLQKDEAGSGALGDIGAHIIDLAQFLTGQSITAVGAVMETFVTSRPLPTASSGLSASAGDERGHVTVDDAAIVIARTDGGALATFEATRFATGRKNALRIEINGSLGSIAFDFERLNELEFADGTLPDVEGGFRRILVTEPGHPYAGAWWPAGHGLGYEHLFVHQAKDFVDDIIRASTPSPSFADGLGVQRVLDAIERSARDSASWTSVN